MFRKRTVLITCGLVLILAAGLLGFLLAKGARKSDGDGRVPRFEWIKMLDEQFGIGEYRENIPYFQDVDRQNGYFAYVQSAVEWEVLEKEEKFNGDSPVTGEFAVVTAMRAMGKYRLQIYLESDKEPDTSDYLRLAYEYELITEERLDAELDEAECSAILETVQNLNTQILWKDDYVKAVTKENVLEMESGNIFGYDAETGQIQTDPSAMEKVEAGDIIVFDTGYAGLKTAGKVEALDSSGIVTVSRPSVDEVFDVLVLSDVVSLSEDDFTLFYELHGRTLDAGQGRSSLSADNGWQEAGFFPANHIGYAAVPAASFSAGLQNKGVAFSVTSENNLVKIRVTDNNTGASLEQSFAAGLEEDTAIECSFEVTDIDVGAQVLYEWGSLKYADVQLYVCLGEKINVSVVSEEVKIPLGTLTIPLAGGIASVQLQLNLVLSVEGDILIAAEIPAGAHFAYEAEKGLRSIPMNLSYTEPQIELSAEIEAAVCPKAVLTVLLLWDAAEMDLKAGVSAGAEMALHSTQTCTDLSVACPVISLGVTVDPILIPPLSKEWELLSKEDAPFRWSRHYEVYQDGRAGFVEVCTYGEQREEESGALSLPAVTAPVDELSEGDAVLFALQQGDFSQFAGTYQAGENDNNGYGGGEPLEPLVLQDNGVITGGGAWYSSDPYPASEPISVEKREDGSYLCQITFFDNAAQSYFLIYPEGVVGEYTAGLDTQFLTDTLYIECLHIDGGVMDVVYVKTDNLQLSPDASVTDDSKPVETIEELWAKLDGIWVFEEYTYNGKTVNYPELTMEFNYTDDIPCMHQELRSNIENWSSPPDKLCYEIVAVDAEHYDVYYYKKGSYDGTEYSNWGSDILACWYSIDLMNLSNGELIISPHMTFSNGFTDNYSVFRYRLEDDT